MFTSKLFVLLLSITAANAINMTFYTPVGDVPAGLKGYIKEYYATVEDPKATTEFTDYWSAEGELKFLNLYDAIGATDLLALKQKFVPVAGYKRWNHFPGNISIVSDNTSQAIYHLEGNFETTYDATHGGNCSSAAFVAEFTIIKVDGELDFTPRNGRLLLETLNAIPAYSPTNIPCLA